MGWWSRGWTCDAVASCQAIAIETRSVAPVTPKTNGEERIAWSTHPTRLVLIVLKAFGTAALTCFVRRGTCPCRLCDV